MNKKSRVQILDINIYMYIFSSYYSKTMPLKPLITQVIKELSTPTSKLAWVVMSNIFLQLSKLKELSWSDETNSNQSLNEKIGITRKIIQHLRRGADSTKTIKHFTSLAWPYHIYQFTLCIKFSQCTKVAKFIRTKK